MRNPKWVTDEVILALDLYFKLDSSEIVSNNPQIVALSNLLRALPIHNEERKDQRFRNPNGVAMKLSNFKSLDPDYAGIGLASASTLDKLIWDEYSSDPNRLTQTANAIRKSYKDATPTGDKEVFTEGYILTRQHKAHERNNRIVKRKKDHVLTQTGRLACEVCGFDFYEVYGELGQGFAECHHLMPLSELDSAIKTSISDLAIVCANCHRMIHRDRRTLGIDELRQIVSAQ